MLTVLYVLIICTVIYVFRHYTLFSGLGKKLHNGEPAAWRSILTSYYFFLFGALVIVFFLDAEHCRQLLPVLSAPMPEVIHKRLEAREREERKRIWEDLGLPGRMPKKAELHEHRTFLQKMARNVFPKRKTKFRAKILQSKYWTWLVQQRDAYRKKKIEKMTIGHVADLVRLKEGHAELYAKLVSDPESFLVSKADLSANPKVSDPSLAKVASKLGSSAFGAIFGGGLHLGAATLSDPMISTSSYGDGSPAAGPTTVEDATMECLLSDSEDVAVSTVSTAVKPAQGGHSVVTDQDRDNEVAFAEIGCTVGSGRHRLEPSPSEADHGGTSHLGRGSTAHHRRTTRLDLGDVDDSMLDTLEVLEKKCYEKKHPTEGTAVEGTDDTREGVDTAEAVDKTDGFDRFKSSTDSDCRTLEEAMSETKRSAANKVKPLEEKESSTVHLVKFFQGSAEAHTVTPSHKKTVNMLERVAALRGDTSGVHTTWPPTDKGSPSERADGSGGPTKMAHVRHPASGSPQSQSELPERSKKRAQSSARPRLEKKKTGVHSSIMKASGSNILSLPVARIPSTSGFGSHCTPGGVSGVSILATGMKNTGAATSAGPMENDFFDDSHGKTGGKE